MIGAFEKLKKIGASVIFMAMASSLYVAMITPQAHAAGASDDEKEASRAVEMNAIVFPVIIDDRLVNYLFHQFPPDRRRRQEHLEIPRRSTCHP